MNWNFRESLERTCGIKNGRISRQSMATLPKNSEGVGFENTFHTRPRRDKIQVISIGDIGSAEKDTDDFFAQVAMIGLDKTGQIKLTHIVCNYYEQDGALFSNMINYLSGMKIKVIKGKYLGFNQKHKSTQPWQLNDYLFIPDYQLGLRDIISSIIMADDDTTVAIVCTTAVTELVDIIQALASVNDQMNAGRAEDDKCDLFEKIEIHCQNMANIVDESQSIITDPKVDGDFVWNLDITSNNCGANTKYDVNSAAKLYELIQLYSIKTLVTTKHITRAMMPKVGMWNDLLKINPFTQWIYEHRRDCAGYWWNTGNHNDNWEGVKPESMPRKVLYNIFLSHLGPDDGSIKRTDDILPLLSDESEIPIYDLITVCALIRPFQFEIHWSKCGNFGVIGNSSGEGRDSAGNKISNAPGCGLISYDFSIDYACSLVIDGFRAMPYYTGAGYDVSRLVHA
jgi:hypothetical protein